MKRNDLHRSLWVGLRAQELIVVLRSLGFRIWDLGFLFFFLGGGGGLRILDLMFGASDVGFVVGGGGGLGS